MVKNNWQNIIFKCCWVNDWNFWYRVCPCYFTNGLQPTYRPEGPRRYMGEPVPMAASSRSRLGYDGLLETISKPSKMWLTFVWTHPINKGLDCIDVSLWSPELYSAFINSFPFLNRNNGWLVNYFYKIPKVCQSYKHAILELCLLLKINLQC